GAEPCVQAVPDEYAFDSAFGEGSSISYSGQVFRHVLIDDMNNHLDGMTDRLDLGEFYPASGDVQAELEFYLDFDSSIAGTMEHGISLSADAEQATYDDVSSGKDLTSKLAGNDTTGQHADWSTDFLGWDADDVTTPESLVRHWISVIDEQAVDWAAGSVPTDGEGNPVPEVFVTPEGQDLQQLIEKFLRGAVAFSQAADDYLDGDVDGKGLLASHAAPDNDALYTDLEHNWDEAFGYFGAARTYPQWTDSEIKEEGDRDVDGNGTIDLLSEVNWGHSLNAAKRDVGASDEAPTDFTAEAWEGFSMGRSLLSSTAGTDLDDDQHAELTAWAGQAIGAWEKVIAANVVHYINDTIGDLGSIGTDDHSFADLARHWSETKGFALSLQFNPASALSDEDFGTLHDLLGTAPVTASADSTEVDAYVADLLEARTLLGQAYGFDDANLGDDDGQNGW
ncbi:MAG: DUF4856 domain-containing protein, partial [Myxococcota bacterium]|nr:DUF4856 domain-containing protein [Myxococcota bacterium]